MSLSRTTVAYILLIAIGVVALFLLAYQVVRGEPISPFVLSLLSLITGFIGASIAGAQGAVQALSLPPGHVLTPDNSTREGTSAVPTKAVGEG